MSPQSQHSPDDDEPTAPAPVTRVAGSGSTRRFVSTPWPGLNAHTLGNDTAVLLGQVISISSADHQLARALLREWHDHLQGEYDERPVWVACHPNKFPTPESLVEWTRSQAKQGRRVFIDNFPDIGGRHLDGGSGRSGDDGRVTEYDMIAWTVTSLFHVARETNGLIVLGARMADGAENAVGREVERHLARGEGVVESRCRTSMLVCTDPETGEPWGWLYNHPHADLHGRVQQWFPLRSDPGS